MLDRATNDIIQTNITTGKFEKAIKANNGAEYFLGSSYNGVYYLNNGIITPTNITTGNFTSALNDLDGNTFLFSNSISYVPTNDPAVLRRIDLEDKAIPAYLYVTTSGMSKAGIIYIAENERLYEVKVNYGNDLFVRKYGE
jgi:hypothetical protein